MSATIGRPMHWQFGSTCPPEWERHLSATDGGFFHTPAGLNAGAPCGEPLFGLWYPNGDDSPAAVAVGVRTRCRYSIGARHVYLPSLPAVRPGASRESAMRTLFPALRRHGAAEVHVDTYDADWSPEVNGQCSTRRFEFVLGLADGPDRLVDGGGRTHQRHYRRGERSGWTLHVLCGRPATAAMDAADTGRGSRAEHLHRALIPGTPGLAVDAALLEPGTGWGTTVFAARAGDDLLAAALVGWANRRAFYVSGGSTVRGYSASAAVWMHWRIALVLAEQGFRTYNLGGVPSAAGDLSHPGHGLFRFKAGFGTDVRDRTGMRRVLGPLHARMHDAGRWLAGAGVMSRAAAT